MVDEAGSEKIRSFLTKLLAPLRILGKMYAQVIGGEFRSESQRLVQNLLLLMVALFLVFNLLIMINALSVFALYELLHDWFYSALIVMGIQAFIAILLFLLTKYSLKKPFFQKTKKIINEAYQEMR